MLAYVVMLIMIAL